ncbi:MAG: methionine--tRNA ligase subunit beta [Candidatus Diapherotrites archaeon]
MNNQSNIPKPNDASHTNSPPHVDGVITIDQFLNFVKLKTAKVINVEDIPGKDKLYHLTLEVGDETRSLVAGVKPWYSKEELIGKTICIVSNLESKKLGGVISQGMLLAALDDDMKFSLLVCERQVKSGVIVR